MGRVVVYKINILLSLLDNETESSKWGRHLDFTQAVMFFLSINVGWRKSDRWFSCRMACVCWSGLLAGQARLIPAASYFFRCWLSFLLCCTPRSLCGFVYVHGYGMYTQTWTSHWQSKRCLKQQTKEILKKNQPSTKNEENKKTPRASPNYPSSGFFFFLAFFMFHRRFSVLIFFSFWHEKREKKGRKSRHWNIL